MSRTVLFARPLRSLTLLTALASLCALVWLPGTARAGAYTYSVGTGTQRTVNAGILVLDGSISGSVNSAPTTAQGADDKDPYVFYILNQRIDVKPFGWNIVNPLAPPSVSSTVYQRWLSRTTVGPTYQLGQTLSQAMAGYWEVPLKSTSTSDLSKFDVLLLNLEQSPAFTASDSEKLRRFVEGGGTLWIENSGTAANSIVSQAGSTTGRSLFFNLRYNNTTAGSAYLPTYIRAPLITVPYQLSEAELNTLGDKHIGGYYADNGANAIPQDASGRLVFSTIIGNSGDSNLPVVAQASYGAGNIVVTTTGSANAINQYVGGVNIGVGGNSGPFCGTALTLAPTPDLKLVADIIASTGGHPNEHQNSHQSGNDTGSLPSAVQTWSYTLPNGTITAVPSGAVINGHIGYAVVGTSLIAFDLYPAEDLDGDGDPDDGKALFPDYDSGLPYDVVWAKNLGGPASAPTIGTDANSKTMVLVELTDGSVQAYDATTGNTTTSLGATAITNSSGRGTYPVGTPIPSPTIFDGRIYAGGADGTLCIYNIVTGTGNAYKVDPAATTTNPVLAAPTVGIIPVGSTSASSTVPTNDIVALCVTKQGLFSVFVGSRGEQLAEVGTTGSYNPKLITLTGAMLDTTAGYVRSYVLNTDNEAVLSAATANTAAPFFTGGPNPGPLYADYDVDFANTPNTINLTRTYVGASAMSVVTGGTFAGLISAPALDRFGNVYYTVTDQTTGTSSLVSVHDGPNQNQVHMNWRFLLPKTGASPGLDADNTNYDALLGYQFTTTASGIIAPSAPVVDAAGNVYVLASAATGTAGTALLSFNTQGAPISAEAVDVSGQTGGISSVSITQPFPGTTTDEFLPGETPTTIQASQYTLDTSGHIEFTDFAMHSGGTAGTANLYPDLNEPYPVTVGFSTGGTATTQNQNLRPLHTNLSWYTVFNGMTPTGGTIPRPTITAASGITLVGGTLYFVDGGGSLTSVPADPAGAGFTVTNKFVESATVVGSPALYTTIGNAGVGATTAVPSSSNGAMLVNGPGGLTAYTNQVTLVVDANRVLEMNSAGDAEWAVDSTSKTTLAGDTTPSYNNTATTGTATGQYVTTNLELNRPTSLTELTANDYLIADTGNNRCVRFDRGGKVLWELTKFTDPFGKLKPGEPDTLNQPTSVQIRSEANAAGTQTIVRYLISDTGNDRIVEVDDVFDKNFNYVIDAATKLPEYHVLNWISHTHDVQGRDYRYQSAAYYASPVNGKYYVVALITNKRLAPFTYPTTGTLTAAQYANAVPSLLGPANQDVAGGTIVLLDYDPANFYGSTTGTFGTNDQADGFIATTAVANGLAPIAISTIKAYLKSNGSFDVAATQAATGTPNTLYIRNPRYLKVVTKLQTTGGTTNSVRHYLLADDNGVWDLDGTSFLAQFGFTQADYAAVKTPISQDGVTGTTIQTGTGTSAQQIPFDRTQIPFLPTAIQLTGTDLVTVGTTATTVGRYLITNAYSQGEAVNKTGGFGTAYIPTTGPTTGLYPTTNPIPGFGGEVFEVHYVGSAKTYMETHDNTSIAAASTLVPPASGIQAYTGHTISRPAGINTSPLSQPAFAYRLQF